MEIGHDQYLNRLNGLLRMRNVGVCVTGGNSKLLSHDVMTEFRGRGDEVRIRPLSFSEFMQGSGGDRCQGWAEYAVRGGMPLARVALYQKGHHDIETPPVSSYVRGRRTTRTLPRRRRCCHSTISYPVRPRMSRAFW